jgi:hypothetical protein
MYMATRCQIEKAAHRGKIRRAAPGSMRPATIAMKRAEAIRAMRSRGRSGRSVFGDAVGPMGRPQCGQVAESVDRSGLQSVQLVSAMCGTLRTGLLERRAFAQDGEVGEVEVAPVVEVHVVMPQTPASALTSSTGRP